jgi:predicted nucleic acid-binding protein
MTVIVDTGVLYADHDVDAARHDTADAALRAVYDGELGQPNVTDYVYDEAVTLALQRSGSFEIAKTLGQRIRGGGDFPSAYEMRRVATPAFETAVEIFEQYNDQDLSFTDATTIALARRHDIDTVLSFNDDFDGLVDRTDPATV